jgi:hypothetical protein
MFVPVPTVIMTSHHMEGMGHPEEREKIRML